MKLGKMTIEGFGSIQALFYVWNRPGINIIQGKNGSGKTTLISALCWVTYGQTLKNSIDPWRKSKDYKGTMVTMDYGSFKVVRCKDYKGKIEGQKGGSRTILYIKGI